MIDLGGTKPINEVKFSVTGARKVVIEGCKTTNASEFKRVGESKGITYLKLIIGIRLDKQAGLDSGRFSETYRARTLLPIKVYHLGRLGRFLQCSHHRVCLKLIVKG